MSPERIRELRRSANKSIAYPLQLAECLDVIEKYRAALIYYANKWPKESVGEIARKALGREE